MRMPDRPETHPSRCDITVPTPTHAESARTLLARISTGTLCTIAIEPAGYPYGSFVTVAFDDGNPVFLISALAEHTHNLERAPRASLLVAEGGSDDPLANGRVTMLGECRPIAADHAPELKHAGEAFFAVHPNARDSNINTIRNLITTPSLIPGSVEQCGV